MVFRLVGPVFFSRMRRNYLHSTSRTMSRFIYAICSTLYRIQFLAYVAIIAYFPERCSHLSCNSEDNKQIVGKLLRKPMNPLKGAVCKFCSVPGVREENYNRHENNSTSLRANRQEHPVETNKLVYPMHVNTTSRGFIIIFGVILVLSPVVIITLQAAPF